MAKLLIDSDMAKMPRNCHMCYLCLGGYCPIAPSETDGCCAEDGRPEWCPLSIAPEPPKEKEMTELESLIDDLIYCGHDMYYDDMWEDTIRKIKSLCQNSGDAKRSADDRGAVGGVLID